MKRSTLILLKTATWIACLAPLPVLAWRVQSAPDPAAMITFSNGYTTLILLAVTLAITPVRRLFPRLSWLVRFRRLLGLFAFFYASIHMLDYLVFYSGFDWKTTLEDISKRKFITAGVAAYLLLVPLALTSTTWAIRKLGGKRWNLLHKLIYVAATLGVIHFWWQVKPGVLKPLPITSVVVVLLLMRVAFWLRSSLRRTASAQRG